MRWSVVAGDILDVPADVLICSANPYLNLSGGVGGAMLVRYGPTMQEFLHASLANAKRCTIEPGEIVVTPPCGAPYTAVIHAVAVDAFYRTSIDIVRKTASRAIEEAARLGARRVALAALATGYGRMPVAHFADAIRPLLAGDWAPISDVTICVRREEDAAALRSVIER